MDIDNTVMEIDGKIEEMIKRLSKAHDNIKATMTKIMEQDDKVNKEIDLHYDELVEKLMKQKDQVKQKLHEVVSQKIKTLTAQFDEVELVQVEMEGLKMKDDSLMKAPNDDDDTYTKQKKLVNKWLLKLESSHEQINLQPIEMDKIEFFPSKSELPEFCHLSVGPISANSDEEMLLPDYICINKTAKAVLLLKGSKDHSCGKQVSVQLEAGTGEVTAAQVQDNNDGSYTASFVGKQVGKAKLIVSVDGKQITGSPYTIEICRNYSALDMPSKVVEDSSIVGQPQNIAFSLCGLWAVLTDDQVYIFDGQNQLVKNIRKHPGNNVELHSCQGVAFDANNCLYVTDSGYVKKFDVHGNYLLQFRGADSGNDQLQTPRGITTHCGKVYVADSKSTYTQQQIYIYTGCIFVFRCDGQFCTSFGSDNLKSAYDVAVNANNQLLVADFQGNCICIFTPDGQYVGATVGDRRTRVDQPISLATDRNGFVFVTDNHDHVIVFDKYGNVIHLFTGSCEHTRWCASYYYSIAVDPNSDTVHLVDNYSKRIQIFADF
ncbi:tripartite motif-containing protein 2-like [Dysidea avara]|uniref:tripartite motif-containing protein 2-like n=1 Tax=Dysidea avara TaxID=196820 RepID=UPI00332F3626